ncbi:hypothetical protein RIF29_20918 [Crotalaria pallida]|uniref:Uncharacterized protein n=1 Tax=Crotalaria pallida TaxID=3830 RepID=A0AAN9I5H6_CROPI
MPLSTFSFIIILTALCVSALLGILLIFCSLFCCLSFLFHFGALYSSGSSRIQDSDRESSPSSFSDLEILSSPPASFQNPGVDRGLGSAPFHLGNTRNIRDKFYKEKENMPGSQAIEIAHKKRKLAAVNPSGRSLASPEIVICPPSSPSTAPLTDSHRTSDVEVSAPPLIPSAVARNEGKGKIIDLIHMIILGIKSVHD